MSHQKRKLEDLDEAFCQTPPKKSRTSYSLDFKINVLDNSKSFTGNRTLASHFGINEIQVRNWKKDEEKIRNWQVVVVHDKLCTTVILSAKAL